MMLFDQHDAEAGMYEVASRRGERAMSLHCLSARSALCAFFELKTTTPDAIVAISKEGVRVSPADLRDLAIAETEYAGVLKN